TVINNVETLANVPAIVDKGAEWFRTLGTASCPGTKVFTLCGDVAKPGALELPMGVTLRELIFEMGGGMANGRRFKMAQLGGTSGACLPPEMLDISLDYDKLAAAGPTLGSGALLVVDDTRCVVDLAKSFARFFVHESCGKCIPCREGTLQLYNALDRMTKGEATVDDVAMMESLAEMLYKAPLCPLGQTAPVPVMSALKYYRDEFFVHINEKRCPAGTCAIPAGGKG
ncbi:MAG: SLBB domain-containing protein, partial [Firmicutes bacterium]|nr:SLBB domain-containing protein [Bacillota bacterium]